MPAEREQSGSPRAFISRHHFLLAAWFTLLLSSLIRLRLSRPAALHPETGRKGVPASDTTAKSTPTPLLNINRGAVRIVPRRDDLCPEPPSSFSQTAFQRNLLHIYIGPSSQCRCNDVVLSSRRIVFFYMMTLQEWYRSSLSNTPRGDT